MHIQANPPGASFFLGASTPGGFYSLFGQLADPAGGGRLLIIKGGPGTGKSSLMRRIAGAAAQRGLYYEQIFCSSDPDSLDAVILPGLGLSVADGTPPHTLEPRYPGVCETLLDLGRFRNDAALAAHREEIVALTDENRAQHAAAAAFLKAAESVTAEIDAAAEDALDEAALHRFAVRFAASFVASAASSPGRERLRFLSAFTPAGIKVLDEGFGGPDRRTVVLRDEYGLAANAILTVLSQAATAAGFDVVRCPCPTAPESRTEHLFVPGLSLAVVTANAFHPFPGEAERTVSCARFYDRGSLAASKNRLRFCRRARRELYDAAVEKLAAAKGVHDALERHYIRAMDFSALNGCADRLIADIFGA